MVFVLKRDVVEQDLKIRKFTFFKSLPLGSRQRIVSVEESAFDRSFSDIEDDDYRYDDNDGSGDDYDIDNDSDFWRRAGD